MSETAPETTGGGGLGGTLGRKLGPLPVWAWLLILTGLAVGYWLLKGKGSSSSSSTGTDTGTTPAGDVPDYVSQTTVNVSTPAEPGQTGTGSGATSAPPATTTAGKPPVSTTPVKATPAPKAPAAKTTSKQPPVLSKKYTVKAGDTLDSLAKKFGISRVDLAHANGLGTGAGLKTGEQLNVPGPVVNTSAGGRG
jgi:LysM repeat protein